MNRRWLIIAASVFVLTVTVFVVWGLASKSQEPTSPVGNNQTQVEERVVTEDQEDGWLEVRYVRSGLRLFVDRDWQTSAFEDPKIGIRSYYSNQSVELAAWTYASANTLAEWRVILDKDRPNYNVIEGATSGERIVYVGSVSSEPVVEDDVAIGDSELDLEGNYTVGVIKEANETVSFSECTVSGPSYSEYISTCNRVVGK